MWLRTNAGKLVVAVLALVGATLLDDWAYQHLVMKNVYERDWGRMLRIAGFLPTWAIVSLGIFLGQSSHSGAAGLPRRKVYAFLPLIAAIGAGLAAEILKLLLRRERPSAHDGEYFFRAWSDRPFSTGGLALPSSHTLLAFGAAAMLARMYPRGRWLWYAVAAGCGLTRVLARAHFVSDIALAAVVGWAVTALIWRRACAPLSHAGSIRPGSPE